jgi:hypothetical protein
MREMLIQAFVRLRHDGSQLKRHRKLQKAAVVERPFTSLQEQFGREHRPVL